MVKRIFKSLLRFDCFSIGTTSSKKYFPEEILVDVLMRFTVKSLVRFKCVSKSWKTLISDEYFKGKHRNHAKNNKKNLVSRMVVDVGIGHWDYSCCLSSPSSSAQPLQKLGCPSNHKSYVILCCCDGLSLLRCHSVCYLLWNLSTNEFSDTTGRTTTYGLGYDSISDDYKILMVASTARPPNRIKLLGWHLFMLHFIGSSEGIIHHPSILSLHLIYQMRPHGEISLPELKHRRCDFRCVVSAFDEMFCVYSTCQDDGETETLKLWVMKEYGVNETWTQLCTIRGPHLLLAKPLFTIPKYMFAEGEVLLGFCTGGFRTSKGAYELFTEYHGRKV
ncbi:hypothetical protein T459_20958 [Capsicum annuum]|uniref:F-box domain-containing protein n=1 Tax=Capsicum annuum TaxID=4072 RepID=A0A2G2Z603_CAPAN|nr:uncharacterized protein LOC124885496 [Capsicum annuum]PHT77436.1 hypothetical protein T459_20958 [Capsicum annuum]